MDRPPRTGPFEVLALAGPPGARHAFRRILNELPADVPLSLIEMEAPSPQGTAVAQPSAETLPFAVEDVRFGSVLAPGKLLICPSRSFVEVLPDRTCAISACEAADARPIDRFLESIARSVGDRAIAVVLTGAGDDGLAGALALHLAGGYVLAQSDGRPRMSPIPGAGMLVVPLCELGWILRWVTERSSPERVRTDVALQKSELRLAAQAGALAKLNSASSRLWQIRSLEAGLDEMLAATIDLVGADRGNVQVLDSSRGVLTIAAQRGFQREFLEYFREVLATDDSACGRALRARERISVEDVETEESFAPMRDIARNAGFRSVQSTPLIGQGGRPLGMISTHWARPHLPGEQELRMLDLYARQAADFIERYEHERVREELLAVATAARAEAEAANRAKDEFLATLSHELRTPLTAILLWAGALSSGAVPPRELTRAITAIAESAKSQSLLIEDLLDLSRLVTNKLALQPSAVDAAAVVSAVAAMVKPLAAAKNLQLSLEVDGRLGMAVLDGVRVKQILWNLLANAVKFTPAQGQVLVRARKHESQLEMEVVDTGEGIAPEFLPHVFERFRQGDEGEARRHLGLGIGLALAQQLVMLHGGTIEAESEGLGRGALFRVRLPWIEPTDDASRDGEMFSSDAARLPLRGLRIILVEDDVNTRDAMQWMLEHAGARVIAVGSASPALDFLRGDTSSEPILIVADLGLPGISGYELIESVAEHCRNIGRATPPACAVSAHAREADRDRAFASGFDVYVKKPVTPERLVQAVLDLEVLLDGKGEPELSQSSPVPCQ